MRFKCLLLASFMLALPSAASAASIHFIHFLEKGNPEIVNVAAIDDVGVGAGELTSAWLDGTEGSDQTINPYYVDALSNEQDVQYNLGYDPNVRNPFDFLAWSDGTTSGDSYLVGLAQVGPSHRSGRIRWFDLPPGKGREEITSTPEPATLLLLGTGLVGLATRRRNKSQS